MSAVDLRNELQGRERNFRRWFVVAVEAVVLRRNQGRAVDPSGKEESESSNHDIDRDRTREKPSEAALNGFLSGRLVAAVGDGGDRRMRELLIDRRKLLNHR